MDIIGSIGSLVNINLSVFAIQIINLFVLMILLNALLYKPVLRVLSRRQEIINQNLARAEEIKKQAEERIYDARKNILDAKERSRALLLKTEKLLEDYKEENVRNLRKESEESLKSRMQEIDSFREHLMDTLSDKKDEFTRLVLERILV